MRTTTYTAPDKRRGYTAGELAGLLAQHPLTARVKVRPGWSGQVQVVIVEEDETDDYERQSEALGAYARHADRLAEYGDRCKLPPPDLPTGLGPNLQRRIDGLPEYDRLQGSLDATADEEWLRDRLVAAGVHVADVEQVARDAQRREDDDPCAWPHARADLAAAGIDLAVIDEVAAQYAARVAARNSHRSGGTA